MEAALTVATRHRRAALALLVLGLYLEIVEWIDLFPWNDVRRGNGQEGLDVALALLFLLMAWGLRRRWRGIPTASALLLALWLGLQIWTFWLPYLGGASDRWIRIHHRWFAQTVQWLPAWPRHPPPDANHFVLQLLFASAFALSLHAALSTASARRTPPGVSP